MKRLLFLAVIFLVCAAFLWMLAGTGPLAPIETRMLGWTNHPAGPARCLLAITNRGTVRVEGMIAGEMIPGRTWSNTFSPTGLRFYHFNFRPGEGALFGCMRETNYPGKILVTCAADSERTALIRKLRELRKFHAKNPRDMVPGGRTFALDFPTE
jgi:hypothetical protein